MKKNDCVRLRSFLGLHQASRGIKPEDNFWQLIGQSGVVVDDQQPSYFPLSDGFPRKVLVRFTDILDALGLSNHNQIKDTLWISVSDLELIDKKS